MLEITTLNRDTVTSLLRFKSKHIGFIDLPKAMRSCYFAIRGSSDGLMYFMFQGPVAINSTIASSSVVHT
jgi:hypothetical protein